MEEPPTDERMARERIFPAPPTERPRPEPRTRDGELRGGRPPVPTSPTIWTFNKSNEIRLDVEPPAARPPKSLRRVPRGLELHRLLAGAVHLGDHVDGMIAEVDRARKETM